MGDVPEIGNDFPYTCRSIYLTFSCGFIFQSQRKTIEPEHLSRLQKYASRVKLLGRVDGVRPLEGTTDYVVSTGCYRALAYATSARPLFSNLRALQWPITDCTEDSEANEIFPYIDLFIGPQIQSLKVDLTMLDFTNVLWLRKLPQTLHGLRHIDLGGSYSKSVPDGILNDLLPQLRGLESLSSAGSVTIQNLPHVGNLPALRKLLLAIDRNATQPWGSKSAPAFRSLHTAHLTYTDLAVAVAFVKSMHNGQLVTLEVANMFVKEDDAANFGHLVAALHQHSSHTSLRSLRIHSLNKTAPTNPISHNDIENLFSFKNLVRLSIEAPFSFSLGNDAITHMTQSWRNLECLCLGRAGWKGKSNINLTGLAHLGRLPKLKDIFLVVDATGPHEHLETQHLVIPNQLVTTMDLGNSLMGDPARAAAILSGVFPNLQTIRGSRRKENYTGYTWQQPGLWDEVAALIPIMAEVRQQERELLKVRDICRRMAKDPAAENTSIASSTLPLTDPDDTPLKAENENSARSALQVDVHHSPLIFVANSVLGH